MNFIVWLYTSKSFAKNWQNFGQLHDSMKPTFRSSGNGATTSSFFLLVRDTFLNFKAVLIGYVMGGIFKKNILNYFKIEGLA